MNYLTLNKNVTVNCYIPFALLYVLLSTCCMVDTVFSHANYNTMTQIRFRLRGGYVCLISILNYSTMTQIRFRSHGGYVSDQYSELQYNDTDQVLVTWWICVSN